MSICTFHFDFRTTVRISPCTAFRSVHDYGQGYSRLELDSDPIVVLSHATTSACPAEFSAFEGNPDFVLSLARGLKVIEAFEGHTEGQTVADISRSTGLSRAAACRSLITLQLLDTLSPPVAPTARRPASSSSDSPTCPPIRCRDRTAYAWHITELVHESSSLGVLDGEQVVYIGR